MNFGLLLMHVYELLAFYRNFARRRRSNNVGNYLEIQLLLAALTLVHMLQIILLKYTIFIWHNSNRWYNDKSIYM